jgi:Zn-dependent alcohol dehydrogenase
VKPSTRPTNGYGGSNLLATLEIMNSSFSSKDYSLAAVLFESLSPLKISNIEVPLVLKGRQVKVKMLTSSLCGSQIGEIDAVKGPDAFLPHLLGHEGVAEVLDVGPDVSRIKVGQRVILHWMKNSEPDTENPEYRLDGLPLNAGPIATFSETAIISENRMTAIESTFGNVELSFLGCGVLTAYGVLKNDLEVGPDDALLVIGAGAIGLLSIQVAIAMGLKSIYVSDTNVAKARFAQMNFAVHVINLEDKDSQLRFDKIIDTTGNAKVIESAYELLNSQGVLCLVGVTPAGNKILIDPMPLHYGRKIQGSYGGGVLPIKDIPSILKLMGDSGLEPWKVSSQHFSLSQINEAIAGLRSGEIIGKIPIIVEN